MRSPLLPRRPGHLAAVLWGCFFLTSFAEEQSSTDAEIEEAIELGKHNSVHAAAGEGDLEALRKLIEDEDHHHEHKTPFGFTPLHSAASAGHLEIVKYLIKKGGADMVFTETDAGAQAAHAAANGGHMEVLEHIIELKGDINHIPWKNKVSILHFAIGSGNRQVVEFLLDEGADIEARARSYQTPLHFAAMEGHVQIAEEILDRGVDIFSIMEDKVQAIHIAAQRGHIPVCEFLYLRGSEYAAVADRGMQPLHFAVLSGLEHNEDMVKFLLKQPEVDIHAISDNEATALHYAASEGHADMVALLLDKGADIDHKTQGHMMASGDDAVAVANSKGHEPCVRTLISRGSRIKELKEEYKQTDFARKYASQVLRVARKEGKEQAKAALQVARTFSEGFGVQQDYIQAYAWYLECESLEPDEHTLRMSKQEKGVLASGWWEPKCSKACVEEATTKQKYLITPRDEF